MTSLFCTIRLSEGTLFSILQHELWTRAHKILFTFEVCFQKCFKDFTSFSKKLKQSGQEIMIYHQPNSGQCLSA